MRVGRDGRNGVGHKSMEVGHNVTKLGIFRTKLGIKKFEQIHQLRDGIFRSFKMKIRCAEMREKPVGNKSSEVGSKSMKVGNKPAKVGSKQKRRLKSSGTKNRSKDKWMLFAGEKRK